MKYAFVNGVILDGTKDMEPLRGKALLTDGRKIAGITGNLPDLSGYDVIDLKGRYIMPGLINMHVHLAGNGGNGKPQKQKDYKRVVDRLFSNPLTAAAVHKMVADYAKIELFSGVTTIRTVGGLRDLDTRVRDEISSGKRLGPRILAANEGISVPGGHMAESVAVAAHSIDEALAQVDIARSQNVDLIKLMITGGVMDAVKKGAPGQLKMSAEMVKAVCDKAHSCGLRVAAHVESQEGMKVALSSGVDFIEHGAKPDEETIRLFKKTGASLTTTLSPALPYALFDRSVSGATEIQQYNGRIVFEGIRDMARAAVKYDIPVCLGNDVGCPWITQYDFWRELVYFHKYVDVTRRDVLYLATLRAATLAGIGDLTGSIEEGKEADLIVTEGSPLEDLHVLGNVRMVMAGGKLIRAPKIHRKAAIDARLDPFC